MIGMNRARRRGEELDGEKKRGEETGDEILQTYLLTKYLSF